MATNKKIEKGKKVESSKKSANIMPPFPMYHEFYSLKYYEVKFNGNWTQVIKDGYNTYTSHTDTDSLYVYDEDGFEYNFESTPLMRLFVLISNNCNIVQIDKRAIEDYPS